MSCHRLTPRTAPRFGLYSARPGADLFRRPPPRRRVDNPPAHHLRIRDRAFLRCGGRFLPPHHRRHRRQPPGGSSLPPGGDGGRPRLDGHARTLRHRLGVAELEVPEGGPRRRKHLRTLDADPEARASRWITHRDSGVARGRSLRRRSPVRRGRGRGQRAAKRTSHAGAGDRAGGEGSRRRAGGCCSFGRGRSTAGAATTPHAGRRCAPGKGSSAGRSSSSGRA